MYLVQQFGFPLQLQIDYGLLILYYLFEYVHLYVAMCDVYFDTDGTLDLNMSDI